MMETVAFYSYKGGVGRTLLVANTAQFLALSGRRVVVLDLDFEAPGLHEKLGNKEVLNRAAMGTLHGAIDELLITLEDGKRTSSLKQVAVEVHLPAGTNGSLLLIPAGSAPSQAYWVSLERLQTALRSSYSTGGLAEAVLELQARIADELAPEFLLIDSRTGITELGGLATSLLSDRVVCLTTNTRESINGTKVVAQALRTAPRLSSQQPLRIDFVLTRAARGATDHAKSLAKELGGTVAVLPHDSGFTIRERMLAGAEARSEAKDDDDDGKELFSATLSWIAETFPGHARDAEKARRRMEAIHQAWRHLTYTTEHFRGGTGRRDAWPVSQLRERVRFDKNKKEWREADIVIYDQPADDKDAKPLMIVEYVDGEDRDAAAQWWINATTASVVVVLSETSERRLYSKKIRWDSRSHHSDRWDIPLPADFEALTDPTDVSVDSLLDAVRRGHKHCLDRIVQEWVRCSMATLHGGMPWKPQVAKKIIDALAKVEDKDLARRVLWAASARYHRRHGWGDGDDGFEDELCAGLFAPLLWRLPVEASIDILREHGHRGMKGMGGTAPGSVALALLARDTLGLIYDPDATFRVEGQRILDRSPENSSDDDDRGLYNLTSKFRYTEISFELSEEPPPLLALAEDENERRPKALNLSRVLSERIASRRLVTTGLLGEYRAKVGKVIIYQHAVEDCAGKLALQPRYVGSITLIHETIHALAHLGRDLDGRMWPEFSLPLEHNSVFEPSLFHEALTQYFTYHHIVRLQDTALLHAFEVMSAKQAPAYQGWRRIQAMPMEDARSWFMSVRRGVGGATPWSMRLFDAE